ncbi:MAG: N-acetyltransferase family protein [Bacteroidota bacterium]
MNNCLVRLATLADLPALTEIYNQAIRARQTADTIPMTVEDRKPWFVSHQSKQYPLLVAETDNTVQGYATLSQYRGGRPALKYAVEVSYYIHQDHQRKGLGTRLLEAALESSEILGYKHAFAILLDTNKPSIHLLKKFGFEQWGHLPNIAEIDGQICGQYYYGKHLKAMSK